MSQGFNPPGDPEYFAARAIEERRHARASNSEKARAIHLDMADKYDRLAAGGSDSTSGDAGPEAAAAEAQPSA